MDEIFYTAAILRERADLRERRPTRIQLQHLASRYHGRPVRSMGIVRQVEDMPGEGGTPSVLVTAYDEASGEEVRYEVGAGVVTTPPQGPDLAQFEGWHKGQKVIVEGRLRWADAQETPIVEVTAVRYS